VVWDSLYIRLDGVGLVWVWFSQMVMIGFEAWSCVDPILELLSLDRVSIQFI
jgi:hypothetical protein